jgi:dimethylamine/trimethylamine dehydrogenase
MEGRLEDIRECIGCNVCYAHNSLSVPIRCTQNPTMGEEWRRGWHPEHIEARHADQSVLVVGSGPAGMEAACALGQRGYRVILAEAEQELGGRINRESRLPGLAEYARVRDWRLGQLQRMANVDIYPDNRLDADAIAELECEHVIIATGASWRSDGVGRWCNSAFVGCDSDQVIGVEQILRGKLPEGRVVIYDDEHYYLGSAIALLASAGGCQVALVTPSDSLAGWSQHTQEHRPTMQALIEAGVECVTAKGLVGFEPGLVQLECVYSGKSSQLAADQLIPISTRVADDALWIVLDQRRAELEQQGLVSLQRIGDCRAPGIIAAAVYAGHKAARELGCQHNQFRRDRVVV